MCSFDLAGSSSNGGSTDPQVTTSSYLFVSSSQMLNVGYLECILLFQLSSVEPFPLWPTVRLWNGMPCFWNISAAVSTNKRVRRKCSVTLTANGPRRPPAKVLIRKDQSWRKRLTIKFAERICCLSCTQLPTVPWTPITTLSWNTTEWNTSMMARAWDWNASNWTTGWRVTIRWGAATMEEYSWANVSMIWKMNCCKFTNMPQTTLTDLLHAREECVTLTKTGGTHRSFMIVSGCNWWELKFVSHTLFDQYVVSFGSIILTD